MINMCSQCTKKDDLIEKYLKLIKLLKAKCEKTAKSFAKNNTLSSDTLYQSSIQQSKSQQLSEQAKSELNPQKTIHSTSKTPQLRLAAIIINNKCVKALLNHSLNKIRQSIQSQLSTITPFNTSTLKLQGSLSVVIHETLCQGKIMKPKINYQSQFQKQLLSKIFHLQLQNQSFAKKINSLQKQIQDSQKRFLKETQKKRQSLETVAQQIRQKTQLVVQLQHLIKRYEKALGRSLENITVESVLVQDAQELKKTCLRLQNVNEKLNDDVRNININMQEINQKLLASMEENQLLKNQNKTLKQNNFEISKTLQDHIKLEESYKSTLRRFEKKILAVQRKQKQLLSTIKLNSQLFNSANMVSTKNTELSAQDDNIEKHQSLSQLEIEQKIEEIFTFLFNINNLQYDLKNTHLFDEEELDLLKSHKDIYLKSVKEDSFIEVKMEKLCTKKQLDDSNFDQGDEIYYKKTQNIDQNSFFCALDPTKADTLQLQNSNTVSPVGNMKLIEMEIQKTKLIQKISELKNHQMHIRNVILNLLKVLDLSNPKPQSDGIMQIVFDFFEYSQDEKASIFKQKKKKFWGII